MSISIIFIKFLISQDYILKMAGLTSQLKGLTNMVSAMNEQGVCDADCQNKRNVEKLKNDYIKAQQNLQNAQPNLDRAEKAYYTASKGAGYYSEMQETKHKQKAQATVNTWNSEINKQFEDIDSKVSYYTGINSYRNNIDFVKDGYMEKYNDLVTEAQQTEDKKNINFRLAHFYNVNTSVISPILWWLKVFYWIFYIIMVALFIIKKQYRNILIVPFILIAGLFPLFFEYGISWKNPFKKEMSKIPSIYESIFDTFTHQKIDNIYFIFFSLVILSLLIFSFFSQLPFN